MASLGLAAVLTASPAAAAPQDAGCAKPVATKPAPAPASPKANAALGKAGAAGSASTGTRAGTRAPQRVGPPAEPGPEYWRDHGVG